MYMPMEKDHKRNDVFHLNTDSSGIKQGQLWRKGGSLDLPMKQCKVLATEAPGELQWYFISNLIIFIKKNIFDVCHFSQALLC